NLPLGGAIAGRRLLQAGRVERDREKAAHIPRMREPVKRSQEMNGIKSTTICAHAHMPVWRNW
ncbi:MAG TPA: hypothetical protein VMK82_10910, partial [Steroidobacteraceae bacterium]|nr:hypothetical protein [Steroidobacteraceae bacterium]